MQSRERTQILLADGHPVTAHGITELCRTEAGLDVVGTSRTRQETLAAIRELQPDLLVCEFHLDGLYSLDLIRTALELKPDLTILVFTTEDELLFAGRALRAGARGFVMKSAPTYAVIDAIRRVEDGGVAVSDQVASRLLVAPRMSPDRLEHLTDREYQILGLLGAGHTSREVAERLGLSVKTVDSHRAALKAKLALRNHSELIRFAVATRLSSGEEALPAPSTA